MCAYRLKYFDKIFWFDSNPNIQQEALILVFVLEDQFEILTNIEEYKAFVDDGKKFLVVCSSRLIEDVYKQFHDHPKFYQKFIVFCGSAKRANDIKSAHPLRQSLEDVFYDPADIVTGVCSLQQRITKNKALLDQKVVITIPKPVQDTIPVVYGTQQVKNLHQQSHQKSYYQKPPENQSETKVEKKVVEQKKQEQVIENAKRKTHEKYKICWALKEGSQLETERIKQKYTKKLQRAGYPVDLLDTQSNIRYDENDNPDFYYIVLAENSELDEVRSNMNKIKLLIRVVDGLSDSMNGGDENERLVCSVEDIIKQLDEAKLQDQPND